MGGEIHHPTSPMTPEGKVCRHLITNAMMFYQLPDSDNAVRLLEMIAAHESGGFTYARQLGGPALGLFQMEPRTFRDLCDYIDLRDLYIGEFVPCSPYCLIFDSAFAAGMARAFFLRFPEPIPELDDITGLSRYAKQYWNTSLGKATPEQYANAWRTFFDE